VSLRNSKIVHKILFILAMMVALSAGLTVNGLLRMGNIDQDYSDLLEHEARAVVWLARATSTLNEAGRLLYTMVAEPDESRMRALRDQLGQQETLLKERLDLVVRAHPDFATDIDTAKRAADALNMVAREVERLTFANDDSSAMRIARERYEPAFTDLLAKLRSLIEVGDKDLKAVSERTTQSTLSARLWTLVIAAGGMTLCIALAILLVRRAITGPIERLTATMRQLAAGDLGVSVNDQDRGDEIGGMAQAVQVFKQAGIDKRTMEEAEQAALAQRAERQQRIEESTRRFDRIVGDLLARVTTSVQALHTASDGLAATAEQTQRQSATVSSSAAQATANVETVAAAGTELNASIAEIARQVTEGSQIAVAAESDVSAADVKVANLAEAVGRIGEVTTLISSIAAQTNLLALNATIEAARAGDAGKGFAVVASEVKNLASQTAKATDEIAGQIAAIQSGTAQAVQAIRGISKSVMGVRQLTTAIAGAVEEQGAATAEIVRNVDEAAQGTRSVAETITDVAQAAMQTGEMASTVFRTASEVQQESEALRREIEQYLQDVHAA